MATLDILLNIAARGGAQAKGEIGGVKASVSDLGRLSMAIGRDIQRAFQDAFSQNAGFKQFQAELSTGFKDVIERNNGITNGFYLMAKAIDKNNEVAELWAERIRMVLKEGSKLAGTFLGAFAPVAKGIGWLLELMTEWGLKATQALVWPFKRLAEFLPAEFATPINGMLQDLAEIPFYLSAGASQIIGDLGKMADKYSVVAREGVRGFGMVDQALTRNKEKVKKLRDEYAYLTAAVAESLEQAYGDAAKERAELWYDRHMQLVQSREMYEKASIARIAAKEEQTMAMRKQAANAFYSAAQQGIMATMDASEQAVIAMVTGQKSVGEAIAQTTLALTQQALKTVLGILIDLAAAAVKAAGSQASIPYIGPILAVAAASMIAGVLGAYLSQAQSAKSQMAMGGLVRGGTPGRDSVPAMLMSGERVLNPREAREWEHAQTSGGEVTYNISLPANFGSMSRAQIRRTIRDVFLPEFKSMSKAGYFRGVFA